MKDILIISYNEGAKKFNDSNCDEIINQILLEEPALIYVATQESISGGVIDHYQHRLRHQLEDLNYQLLEKYDASISIPTIGGIIVNKNVRSRVYFNKDKVYYDVKYSNAKELLLSKIKITSKKFKESTKSGFKSLGLLKKFFKVKDAPEPTLFKGSIYTELILDINNNPVKFIFVNSHLFYKKKSNTGIEERIKEFNNLVTEFELIDKWKEGYNIFFCGDLNFRLFSSSNLHYDTSTGKNSYHKSINIIKDYILKLHSDDNEKKEINKELKKESELYNFLNSEANSFYSELKKSIDNIGIHLTAKYKENTINNTKQLFKKETHVTNEKITKVFNILPKNKYIRIPSQTDVILYALSNNISINPKNFKMYLSPDRSDHKMVSLFVDITSIKNNQINNIKTIKNIFKEMNELFDELSTVYNTLLKSNNNREKNSIKKKLSESGKIVLFKDKYRQVMSLLPSIKNNKIKVEIEKRSTDMHNYIENLLKIYDPYEKK